MARLIDDLRARGARLAMPFFVRHGKEAAWEEIAKRVREILVDPHLPVLLIDNVADYYFGSEQEFWDLTQHFPNLAPPWPAFWCEHKITRRIHSKECGDTDVAALIPRGRVGILVHGLAPGDCQAEGVPENVRWILWCELFIDYGEREVTAQGPHGSMFLCVDAEGRVVGNPWMQSFAGDEMADVMRSLMTWMHPAFLAVSFLHCKNVTLVDNRMDLPLAKKYHAKNGIWPAPWRTLVIEPLKKILHTEGKAGETGIQKALHICRGHFRDYREGRGLFGKLHQLVWMPSIVRGSKGDKVPPREIKIKV